MIFCISDGLLKDISEGRKTRLINEFSEQLLGVIKSDNNILTVESNLILKLLPKINNLANINEQVKKILVYCYSNYTQCFGLTKKVKNKIILTSDKDLITDSDFYLSLEYIERHKIVLSNKVTLLSEDLLDCEFYEELSKMFNGANQNGVKASFRFAAGAGKNIAKKLKTSVVHNSDIVFTICDSDKFFPNDTYGETARYLLEEYNGLKKTGIVHMHYHILEVSEKENLIKPSEYKKFLFRKRNEVSKFLEIENNEKINKYLNFLDFKEGVKKGLYLDNRHKKYFDTLFEEFPDFRNNNDIEKIKDKDTISYNLGRKCMEGFKLEHLDCTSSTHLDNYRNKIAQIIFSWGISIRKQHIA